MIINLKTLRDQRTATQALAAKLDQANADWSMARTQLNTIEELRSVLMNQYDAARIKLRGMGAQFAENEGEDDSTPRLDLPEQVPEFVPFTMTLIEPIYDPNRAYARSGTMSTHVGWCACNQSIQSNVIDGKPCVYHRQRNQFRLPGSDEMLIWPLQEIVAHAGSPMSIDHVPLFDPF